MCVTGDDLWIGNMVYHKHNRSYKKLKVAQRVMVRAMLGVFLCGRVRNEEIP